MKISIKDENKDFISFTLSSSSVAFANLLRRYAMMEIPVFAFDKVIIYENSSSLFDEYLAHRIGLLVLSFDGNEKAKEEFLFSLDVSGPKKVYSTDFKSPSNDIKIVHKMPLLILNEGQNIRLEAKAVLGIGRKHAKWQAGLCSYEIVNDNTFNFFIESFGQLSANDMLQKALNIMEEKCEEFSLELKKLKKES
jgi:DNA-directed RNA polymerase subunit D